MKAAKKSSEQWGHNKIKPTLRGVGARCNRAKCKVPNMPMLHSSNKVAAMLLKHAAVLLALSPFPQSQKHTNRATIATFTASHM